MSQNFVTLEVVRELFQMQECSYQAAIKLLITDVRSEMKDIKKEIEEFKDIVLNLLKEKSMITKTE